MEQELCDLLREQNMQEKVMVPSFSDKVMEEFRKICPEVATAASTGEVRNFVYLNFALLAGTITPEFYALQVPESRDGIPIVTQLLLFFANWRNLEVHIWTINDPEDMQRFIDMGVHGIMIHQGGRSGLLLPQVATEYGWDRDTFLDHTCQKAGLPDGCWQQPGARIEIFSAVIFDESL